MTSAALRDLRAEFPALDEGLCFLDWGASGLLPARTRAAMQAFLEKLAACPTAQSVWMWGEHGDGEGTRGRARAAIARMLGAKADDVALVESTTAGLQTAAESARVQEGDNVVLWEHDYPAVAIPWTVRARSRKLEVRFARTKDGAPDVDDLVARIDDRTRVVAVSTIGWTTGALVDLDAIAAETRARGIVLAVDAVQTFGVAPLDVRAVPASYVACGGHKWLCSPLGAGFLYAEPRTAARGRPQRFGLLAGRPARHSDWTAWFRSGEGGPDEEVVFPASGAALETGGQPSWPGAIGLAAATELLASAATGETLRHVRDLGDRLIAGLDTLGLETISPRDPTRRAGIVVFRAPRGREQELAWCDALRRRRVAVTPRWSKGLGGVRVCLHAMNLEADVDRLLDELRALPR
ncbi:MAG TPA: aminotransferase class V-fold PLP-dependent enzyme [Planctomycetota bacterium]|nr:aminotransferase class V-fold PLP-dependent enzyme [Planctomycetota bacterium]